MSDHLSLEYSEDERLSSVWCCSDPACLKEKDGRAYKLLNDYLNRVPFILDDEYLLSAYNFSKGVLVGDYLSDRFPKESYIFEVAPKLNLEMCAYEVVELELMIPEFIYSFNSVHFVAYYDLKLISK